LVVPEPDSVIQDGEQHDMVDERFQSSRSFRYRECLFRQSPSYDYLLANRGNTNSHELTTPWSKTSIPPLANFHQKPPIPYSLSNNFQSFSIHPSYEYFVHDISHWVHLVILISINKDLHDVLLRNIGCWNMNVDLIIR
jgi:hypothetical protein